MIKKNKNQKKTNDDMFASFDHYSPTQKHKKESLLEHFLGPRQQNLEEKILKETNQSQNNKLLNSQNMHDHISANDHHQTVFHFGNVAHENQPKNKQHKDYVNNTINKINTKKLFRYSLASLLLLLGIYVVLNAPLFYYRFSHIQNNNTVQVIAPTPTPQAHRAAPTKESRLLIGKINVDAPLIFIASRKESDVQEGLRDGVVHYAGTAKPGEIGNSFITGHSSNYWWERGSFNYVFSLLDKLEVGDNATIYYNGLLYEYQVTAIKVVSPTDVSVLEQTPTSTLTLMTCTPPGTDWRRLIVSLNQIYP